MLPYFQVNIWSEINEITTAYYMIAATGVLIAAAYYVMVLRAEEKYKINPWN